MSSIEKNVNEKIEKLKKIVETSITKKKIERALVALSTMASLEYNYNQVYVDEFIEDTIGSLATKEVCLNKNASEHNQRRILFYDGFGLDSRGLVQIYLKALIDLKYEVIYITNAMNASSQPQVNRILSRGCSTIYYEHEKKKVKKLNSLREIFRSNFFDTAFFYSTPWDVVGAIAFRELAGQCRRYLINLTDHAFWIGRDSVDYNIEFREYGASISLYQRGFEKKQLLELPYYPIIDFDAPFQGFPKELEGKKVIFSGGSLYKTIDKEGTFYQIIETVLSNNSDVGFLYAGYGDDCRIKQLVSKYPKQAVFIHERSDLYQVLQHSYLYFNTFPISGALMLQYAAKAGCIPVTLRREWDDDAQGILLNEDKLNEVFIDKKEVISEIQHLIDDEEYKNKKEKILKKMVIDEVLFSSRLKGIIDMPESEYGIIHKYDTKKFRDGYRENFSEKQLVRILINKKTIRIHSFFYKEILLFYYYFITRKLFKSK